MSAVAEKVPPLIATRKVTPKSWMTGLCFVAADCAAIFIAAVLTLVVFHSRLQGPILVAALLPSGLALFVFRMLGLYPLVGLSPVQEFRRVLIGSTFGYGISSAAFFLRSDSDPAMVAAFFFAWSTAVLLILLCRALVRHVCRNKPWWGTPTVIFGSGESIHVVLQTLRRHASLGLKPVAVFDHEYPYCSGFDKWSIHVGAPQSARAFVETWGVSHAIVVITSSNRTKMDEIIRSHGRAFKSLLVIPEVQSISSIWIEPRDLGGVLGLHVKQNLTHREPRFLKRLVDILFTGAMAFLLLPLFAILYIAVRLSSPGPAFYGQKRIGRDNSAFTAWKFRSMFLDADTVLSQRLEEDPELRSEWERDHKLRNDPRITPIGRILRKTSLDELPQLWNVLRGDMSLVGPRPIVEAEVARYQDVFEAYKSVRPGITGMWQVSGRNNTTYVERVQFDEYYVRNWSIWLDLYILGMTFKTVLLREGAY